jgi:hypothetical protein
MGMHERTVPTGPAGVMATACMHMGIRRNTGSPSGDRSTGNSRETGRAVWGDGEARTHGKFSISGRPATEPD